LNTSPCEVAGPAPYSSPGAGDNVDAPVMPCLKISAVSVKSSGDRAGQVHMFVYCAAGEDFEFRSPTMPIPHRPYDPTMVSQAQCSPYMDFKKTISTPSRTCCLG